MDWLRRNWPDLLIGVALVAVIAGIVATLLSGGSLFPLGRGEGPSRVAEAGPRPADPVRTPSGATAASEDDTPAILPVLPDLGGVTQPSGPVIGRDEPTQGTQTGTTEPDANSSSDQASTEQGTFVVSPASSAPYRVSAGAYSVRSYADIQVKRLRDAGYPVFTGRQGDLYLVMVGPYESRSRAESAAAELESKKLVDGPLVYECADCGAPAGGADSEASQRPVREAAASQSDASSDVAGAPAAQAAGQQATPEAGTLYLQVGAYGSLDSAQPQRERVQELGYTVTVRRSGDLVKLLIGPFGDRELEAAQARLGKQGIENFATR
ncbi:MAG TPA: SPOR domain-containing protein [Trueperaceae bacterium]